MKRILTLFLPLTILLSSCQKTEYIETLIPNRTILVDIVPSAWISSNSGKSYFTTIDMPEITDSFNERGGVLVYLSFGNRTYEQLPEVYNGKAYSYAVSPGTIELEIQASDGLSAASRPAQAVTAKIILVESQL